MKSVITIACLIILGVYISVEAQSPLLLTRPPSKSEITTLDRADILTGALYVLKDSSILISSSFAKEDYYKGDYELNELYVDDINLISLKGKRSGSMLAGAIMGAGLGVIIAAIGNATYNPPPSNSTFGPDWSNMDGFRYAFYVPALALIGGATGAIIGGVKINIPINGSMENYNRQKKKLGRYTIQYPGAPTY
jgi:hypothetical protein